MLTHQVFFLCPEIRELHSLNLQIYEDHSINIREFFKKAKFFFQNFFSIIVPSALLGIISKIISISQKYLFSSY